ncbi:MAG: hemerythrin domain-containing protein [Candidatus Hodarchaeales archaeon]
MKTIQELMKEHDNIAIMLEILEKATESFKTDTEGTVEHLEQIIDFFDAFGDKCHHSKEEDLLYAALKKSGMITENHPDGVVVINTIASMIKDHQRARIYIDDMREALAKYHEENSASIDHFVKKANNFIAFQRQHINTEDQVLYPLANSHLSGKELQELSKNFERVVGEKREIEKQKNAHKLVEHLQTVYLEPIGNL